MLGCHKNDVAGVFWVGFNQLGLVLKEFHEENGNCVGRVGCRGWRGRAVFGAK
jgi:hypothetical protein